VLLGRDLRLCLFVVDRADGAVLFVDPGLDRAVGAVT